MTHPYRKIFVKIGIKKKEKQKPTFSLRTISIKNQFDATETNMFFEIDRVISEVILSEGIDDIQIKKLIFKVRIVDEKNDKLFKYSYVYNFNDPNERRDMSTFIQESIQNIVDNAKPETSAALKSDIISNASQLHDAITPTRIKPRTRTAVVHSNPTLQTTECKSGGENKKNNARPKKKIKGKDYEEMWNKKSQDLLSAYLDSEDSDKSENEDKSLKPKNEFESTLSNSEVKSLASASKYPAPGACGGK